MFIDSHCHIFTNRIVENVKAKPSMLAELKLNTNGALQRLDPRALQESAEANNVDFCVLLPTAPPDKVRAENDRFIAITRQFSRLRALATLHPAMPRLSDEVRRMFDIGIAGFKFSSFTQRFDPTSTAARHMLDKIEGLRGNRHLRPIIVFDTFVRADVHFGASPDYLTTPAKLALIAQQHQGINVIGAHMGGLLADFDDLKHSLAPAPNLYLDTANAAHTLEADHFIELLRLHGPEHILFGTDWPWFQQGPERLKVEGLLTAAGYDRSQQYAVFGGNAVGLFGPS